MNFPLRWSEIRPPATPQRARSSWRQRPWRYLWTIPSVLAVVLAGAGLVVLAIDRSTTPSAPTPQATILPTTEARWLIDINTATLIELTTIPGIGATRADRILALRAQQPFRSLADLADRGVLSPAEVSAIAEWATVYVDPTR